jgi:hypothetical protein
MSTPKPWLTSSPAPYQSCHRRPRCAPGPWNSDRKRRRDVLCRHHLSGAVPIPTRLLHESAAKSTQFRQERTQTNVGKIPPAHDCALALADSEKYDIVLLQEPWTEAKNSRCLTKTHPAYDTCSPVDSWDSNGTRPRVMTYIRKDSRIFATETTDTRPRHTVTYGERRHNRQLLSPTAL